VASEIAAIVAEEALWYLDAPIRRVSVPDTPIPFAPGLEHAVLPQTQTIVEAVRSTMAGPAGRAPGGGTP
jgi:pyruvate/2-oxoglutarate/acetoin dehydrogenase E1 component